MSTNDPASTSRRQSNKNRKLDLVSTVEVNDVVTQNEPGQNAGNEAESAAAKLHVESNPIASQETMTTSKENTVALKENTAALKDSTAALVTTVPARTQPVKSESYVIAGTERPIASSAIQVMETMHVAGSDRPITASGLHIWGTFHIAGDRPIMASGLQISDTYSSMGHDRPVASNEIDDARVLMGFLD